MKRNILGALIVAASLLGETSLASAASSPPYSGATSDSVTTTNANKPVPTSGSCSETTIGSATSGAGAGKAKFNDVNCHQSNPSTFGGTATTGGSNTAHSGPEDKGDEWHNPDGTPKGGGKQVDGGGQQNQGGGKQVDGGGKQNQGGGKAAGGNSSARCPTCN